MDNSRFRGPLPHEPTSEQNWQLAPSEAPVVAVALHDGHTVRNELQPHLTLDATVRRSEEDPYTGLWTTLAPTRVVGLRSRFEVDLNRPRDKAVYLTPEDAWGLPVWKGLLPTDVIQRSLDQYDAFYRTLGALYDEMSQLHGSFVVYDLHSYNHRRNGPQGPAAPQEGNPQVNVGTGTMQDRARWSRVIDRFLTELANYPFPGGPLDVRENVRFFGGHCARWTHATFPNAACVLSIEIKKFFMDEWTGEPDLAQIEAIGAALQATVPGVLEELRKL